MSGVGVRELRSLGFVNLRFRSGFSVTCFWFLGSYAKVRGSKISA